ncbi:hypothetical protein [Microvirga sp. 2TAF3]|uniref:hypothetical protein n=1 Tax=Microvirga sp. 2TAF3 TaxID=3233014 RepID=UPI003F99DFCD
MHGLGIETQAERSVIEDLAAAKGGTYALKDEAGNVMRTGRTNDFARREAQHLRDPRFEGLKFDPIHETGIRNEQRGLEQMLHDQYQPPLNVINPISPTNPRRDEYMDAARRFLED